MAMRGFAILLAMAGIGLQVSLAQSSYHLARLEVNQAEDWGAAFAEFPRFKPAEQARILKGLTAFLGGYTERLEREKDYGFPALVARQRQLLGLPKSQENLRSHEVADADALGELAANALDYSLAKSAPEVRSEAIEVAEALMPQFYRPEVNDSERCGTGYDYLRGRFAHGFSHSHSLRAYAAKNIAWVEKVDPRDETEGIKLLLRAHLRLPSALSAIKEKLDSKEEGFIETALLGVMQWPDQDFVPLLQRLILNEEARVRPFSYLTEAVMAYREKAPAVIEPVIGSLKYRRHWMDRLADFSCRESWEYCLRLSRSGEAWARALGVGNIRVFAEAYWEPEGQPRNATPGDAKAVAEKIVATALSDPEPTVHAAAVREHDWSNQPERLRTFANDPSPLVRYEVPSRLSDLPAEIRAELIWKLAGDSSLRVQRTIAWKVDQEYDAGLEEPARKALSSARARDRSAAALILAKLGYEQEVLPLLKDRDSHVRASAVLSIGGDMDIEHLLPMCGDESAQVVQVVLEKLLGRYDLYEEQLKMLTKALTLAKPQHAPLVQREIERIKRRMTGDDDDN